MKTKLSTSLFASVTALLLSACATQLPPLSAQQKSASHTLPAPQQTSINGKALQALIDAHSGQSGVYPLTDGVDAFVARLALIEAATSSVDIQYYIYHADETGQLLTWTLMKAAERGVRVRLLLDDMNTGGKDNALALLAQHPNVEVRLFNPFVNRFRRGLEFLGNFARANRRMHNKSLTVDNFVTVVGGRNVGDEYFSANSTVDFGDFDLMAVGPVVPQISRQFDLYWNSEAAYPAEVLVPKAVQQWTQIRPKIDQQIEAYLDSEYVERLRNADIIRTLSSSKTPLYWGQANAIYDTPAKANPDNHSTEKGAPLPEDYMLPQLLQVMDQAKQELVLVSPYFVPGDAGVARLSAYQASDVDVRVITNSLAATDVVAVHSGYQKYRKPLLRAGVDLREVRVDANAKPGSWSGSSRTSLHAKTFYLDERLLFVGSFNLDPRSAALNTELGIVIESPELIRWLKTNFNHNLEETTYQVSLKDGKLHWTGANRSTRSEPDASLWRRMGATLLSWLPIEQYL